jgi:uncharacterized membrane protein YkvI
VEKSKTVVKTGKTVVKKMHHVTIHVHLCTRMCVRARARACVQHDVHLPCMVSIVTNFCLLGIIEFLRNTKPFSELVAELAIPLHPASAALFLRFPFLLRKFDIRSRFSWGSFSN